MKRQMEPVWLYFLMSGCGIFTLATLRQYPGEGYIYVTFAVLLNALLFLGLKRGSIFFDTFLGVFFWIGFWLKFSVRMVFMEGKFHESVGYFDYSPDAYDKALLVTSCAISGLLIARLIRGHFLFQSMETLKLSSLGGVRELYDEHRNTVWFGFCILVLGVTLTNAYLGIYQRGTVPRTLLPYGLGGVYTWLLLFGAASISAVLLHFELQLREKIPYLLFLLMLSETFLSNVSMLSRGMILNASALLIGCYIAARAYHISWRLRTVVMTLVTLLLLFAASIFLVNQMRIECYGQNSGNSQCLQPLQVSTEKVGNVGSKLIILIMDRWVGMEGVMAVSSYPQLGWDLWEEGWREKYSDRGTSLYDRKISKSSYSRQDMSNRHFISLPGVVGFLFYPGSYGLVFLGMLALGILGATIEAAVYKWGGGNVILCSLMALVVAYRFVHFGYVPGRSYLLFGTLALNILLIYLVGRVFAKKRGTGELASLGE